MMRLIIKIIPMFFLGIELWAQQISYTISFENAEQHLINVKIEIRDWKENKISVSMPTWSPGRYVIYDFVKNVQDFIATDLNNNFLFNKMTEKQTWQIDLQNNRDLNITYKVYANTLDGTFSKVDRQGASLNPSSVFMYIVNYKHSPVMLKVKAEKGWQVVSALDENKNNTFKAENYDELIDAPIEVGNFQVKNFLHRGRNHRFVFQQPFPENKWKQFSNDVKKIIDRLADVFGGDIPYPRYTFFYHLDRSLQFTDGMEHRNSTRILLRIDPQKMQTDANIDEAYDNLIWLTAHEFFHLWNVKRLRPAGLGPFDYSKSVNTSTLWIAEGLTNYYAYMSLIRSGIYNKPKLYSEFENKISRHENTPGKDKRSLYDVSLMTWLYYHVPQTHESTNTSQTFYSYYYKGMFVGLLLDFEIRNRTDNRFSLDDVMQEMYKKFYLLPPGDYYMNGSGYTENDFIKTVEKITASDFTSFFNELVFSANQIDYNRYLKNAGLQLIEKEEKKFYAGITTDFENERLKIISVEENSPAQKAGLQTGDLIVAVNESKVIEKNFEDLLQSQVKEKPVDILVSRNGRIINFELPIGYKSEKIFTLSEIDEKNSKQKSILQSWLELK